MNNTKYLIVLSLIFITGCHTTYNANVTPSSELAREGSIVFVRPDKYTILGTRSIRDHIEITYEQLTINQADRPNLTIGIRNRGGQHSWDLEGKDVQLSVQTSFYKQPVDSSSPGPAAYRTNWQNIKLVRGQTLDYKVGCPLAGAKYYQVTISEHLR